MNWFRQFTRGDVTTLWCQWCGLAREFRSPILLRKFKARHPGECTNRRGAS